MTQRTARTTATLPQWPARAIVQGVVAQIPWYRASPWETRIVKSLPKEFKGILPTVEEIEAELSGAPSRTPRSSRRKS